MLLKLDPTARDEQVIGELLLGDPWLVRGRDESRPCARSCVRVEGAAARMVADALSWVPDGGAVAVVAARRVRRAWASLASIRPDHGRDLKVLTETCRAALQNGRPRRPDPPVPRCHHAAFRAASAPCVPALPSGLAEHEHVLVRDDLRAVAFGAAAARVERLPERRAHDQLAVADGRQQAR